jgi:hypothetical protein
VLCVHTLFKVNMMLERERGKVEHTAAAGGAQESCRNLPRKAAETMAAVDDARCPPPAAQGLPEPSRGSPADESALNGTQDASARRPGLAASSEARGGATSSAVRGAPMYLGPSTRPGRPSCRMWAWRPLLRLRASREAAIPCLGSRCPGSGRGAPGPGV